MEIFSGGELDRRVMEKSGCLNYSYTPWVSENSDISERAVYYKFEKHISRYRGEVTSTQQRSPLLSGKGWLLEEVMNLHGVPLGDFFNVSELVSRLSVPNCHIFVFYDLPVVVIHVWFSSPAPLSSISFMRQLHLRYQVEDLPPKAKGCKVQVLFGIEWLKSTKHQKRITKNILQNLQERLKVTFTLAEKELIPK